jgi:tetratricopeptide (TPR) repeat protein
LFLAALIPDPPVQAELQDDSRDPALMLGDRFFDSGAYESAITEYKRVLFFDSEGRYTSSVHGKIAACYQAQKRWPEALLHLRQSIQTASSLQQIEDREFALIATLLASGKDSEAELHLLRLREFSEIDSRRVSLYLCATYVYRGQWKPARQELERAFPGRSSDRLNTLLAEAEQARKKSPRAAVLLSTVVPGSGQLYAGDGWDALNALAVNAGLAALIFTAMKHEYYLEGVLLFLYPFRRYYLGNRDNARLAVERENHTIDRRFQEQIMAELSALLAAE